MAAILRGAVAVARKVAPQIGKVAGKIGGAIGRTAARTPTIVKQGAVITGATVAADAIGRRVSGGGSSDLFGLPVIADPFSVEALRAPRGYVLVQNPDSDDPMDKVAVLKQVAYALGLKKRPQRGGISAREIRAARRVQSVISSLTVNRQPKFKLRKGRKR